jgi:hypothetical protein
MVTSDYQATRVRISKATREAEFLPPILLSSEDSLWAMSGRWFAKDQDMIVRESRRNKLALPIISGDPDHSA